MSEYIEAVKAAEDDFGQLKHLRPVIDDDADDDDYRYERCFHKANYQLYE